MDESRHCATHRGPVFVIGKERSGTKWLTNMIASHPDAMFLAREGAGGVLESNLMHWAPKLFGTLEHEENFTLFVESFSRMNDYLLTGLDKQFLYDRAPRTNALDVLGVVMDEATARANKQFWVMKAHPLAYDLLRSTFPHAKFVFVVRGAIGNVKSVAALKQRLGGRRPRYTMLIKEALRHGVLSSAIHQYAAGAGGLLIRYEDLKENTDRCAREITDYLGWQDVALQSGMWRPNTSFPDATDRANSFDWLQSTIVRGGAALGRAVPGMLAAWLTSVARRARLLWPLGFRRRRLVRFSYSIHQETIAARKEWP